MFFDFASAAVTIMTGTKPWWTGVPTKLLRKRTLVQAAANRLPVHTLTFEIPDPHNDALTGQAKPHADIQIDLGDVVKMVIPGYKPKSYSVSALRPADGEFDVTFKVYPNGRASGFLDRLVVGADEKEAMIHTFGKSANRVRNPGPYVGIVAYGVGITEGLPVAAAELAKSDAQKVTLLWASRTAADTFWHDEIRRLTQQYPHRFQMVQILSRKEKPGYLHGRIDAAVLQQVFLDDDDDDGKKKDGARFLSVGTKEMMRMTDDMFAQIGCPMPQHALLPKAKDLLVKKNGVGDAPVATTNGKDL